MDTLNPIGHQRRPAWARAVLIILGVSAAVTGLFVWNIFLHPPVSAQAVGETTCRFNITVPGALAGYESTFPDTKVGGWLNWSYSAAPQNPNGAEYVQMLRVSNTTYPNSVAAVPTVVPANPGAAWIIGNEPDRVTWQDDVPPATYADRFYALATAIRTLDPTARIGFGSIVQPTPIRLRYLDQAWNRLVELAGSAPAASELIDFWSLHAFILCEDCGWGAAIPPAMTPTPGELLHIDQVCSSLPSVNCFPDTHDNAIFEQFVRDFRGWMSAKGEREKPLWITEYGSLFPVEWVPISETARFMTESFDFLRTAADAATGYPADANRLVQRWFWFSLNHDPTPSGLFMGGNLYDPNNGGAITAVGTAWINYPFILNTATFAADPYPLTVSARTNGTSGWSFTIGLTNDGDASFQGGYDLELYHGDPSSGGVLVASQTGISSAIDGCGGVHEVQLNASFPSLPPWDIYVRLVPTQPTNDSDLTNNQQTLLGFRPQTFYDVPPLTWAWPWVETVFAHGIIDACSSDPLFYCPDDVVDRADMAIFILKGLNGKNYLPPPPSDPPVFPDIDGHPAEAWIEQLYLMGLVSGHADGTYRPDDPVKRSQMAVYLLRAKYYQVGFPPYEPPPANGGIFSDIEGTWAQAWIEQLFLDGIAAGHPDGTYRPDDPVKRSQMAVFIDKTFNLAMVVP